MNNNPNNTSASSRRRSKGKNVTLILLLIMVIAIFVNIFVFTSLKQEFTPADSVDLRESFPEDQADPTPGANGGQTDAAPAPALDGYEPISVDPGEIYFGELVLINGEYPYVSEGVHNIVAYETVVDVYANKTKDYSVKDMSIDLNPTVIKNLNLMFADYVAYSKASDVYINAAWRSLEDQQAIYDAKGNDIAALPGYSEHHSGYAFDVAVHSGGSYSAISDTGHYVWLPENCKKYGFIRRYPEGKTDITGITFEPWHYRYVGVPHSYYITENGLAFEEYIKLLKSYTLMGEHLKISAGEEEYEVYFVPVTETTNEIYVPSDKEYSVSGNNVDGFIVTIKTSSQTAQAESEVAE